MPKDNESKEVTKQENQQDEPKFSLSEAHKQIAIKANGQVWNLLEKNDRTQLENDELLYAVHASSYHWLKVGTGVHRQRGEYLISKVYLSLNLSEAALRHAKRCGELTAQHKDEMKDFDIAYSHECLARAYAMNGMNDKAQEQYLKARESGEKIKDSEDKQIFDGDFETGDWFGIA